MLKVNDTVEYNSAFVSRCGHLKEIADMRGVVTQDKGKAGKNQYLKVLWAGDDEEKGVLSCNIKKIGVQ